ncbi:MAG: 3-deoxy-D-manno-octulosonic acid transferase [Marinosulfonomonas sp.]|nr:MAG: 3-deoxy-D-manno-octulosonic acid transferase [Marinosulfonomonas sp.]
MSLGLRLYLAAARRAGKSHDDGASKRLARPTGRLVWLHISDQQEVSSIQVLIRNLAEDLTEVSFLVTTPKNTHVETPFQECCDQPCLHLAAPADALRQVAEFLDHWQPSIAIWAGSALRPALVVEAHARAIPLLMLNARTRATVDGHSLWNKGVIRATLGLFNHILVSHETVKTRLLRQGADSIGIMTSGLLEENATTLFCDDRDRDAMAETLAARPVWLATCTDRTEEALIVTAHRAASRLSHRLLLVLAPKDTARGDDIARILTDDGWQVAQRSLDQEPDEHVQILIADTDDEMGLWLRIAPVCFMGNSLIKGATGCSPNAATSLGSAVLHGPFISKYILGYARLDTAGAAREVGNATQLAAAVQDLLAPDKAAEMAHAGWEISTSGAEAMDHAIALIYDVLNPQEAL